MTDNNIENWFSEGKRPDQNPVDFNSALREVWDNSLDEYWHEYESWDEYKAAKEPAYAQKIMHNWSTVNSPATDPIARELRDLREEVGRLRQAVERIADRLPVAGKPDEGAPPWWNPYGDSGTPPPTTDPDISTTLGLPYRTTPMPLIPDKPLPQ